jgi:hypothetical protein
LHYLYFLLLSDPGQLLSVVASGLQRAFPAFSSEKLAPVFGYPLLMDTFKRKTGGGNWMDLEATSNFLSASSAAQRGFERSVRSFERIAAASPSALVFRPDAHQIRISRQDSALGKFIVLGRMGDSGVRVTFNERANEMHRTVFSKVLNDSVRVDFANLGQGGAQDGHYFVKSPIWRSSEDIVQLRRLERVFNLTMHESQSAADNSKILDVRLHLPNVVLNVRYGASASSEKTRLLRHSLRSVTRWAWAREKERLLESRRLNEDSRWSMREAREIQNQGFADGYDVAYVRDVRRNPELANDLDNVQFVVRNNKRRRRRKRADNE